MRCRSPYTLFKKTLKSGRSVWYFYFYDERNVRRQFSTGCRTKAQAEIYCLELYNSGAMFPAQRSSITMHQKSSLAPNVAQKNESEKDKVPLFRDFLKTWFDYDKCDYIQKRLQFGYVITRSYAEKRRRENDLYLLPFWGKYRIDEVSEELCDKWIAYLKEKRYPVEVSKKTWIKSSTMQYNVIRLFSVMAFSVFLVVFIQILQGMPFFANLFKTRNLT